MEILLKIIEAMVVTLREGIEAALVVGIVLAYLKKSKQDNLNVYVYWGLGVAVFVSLLGALLAQKLGLDLENELVEGSLMFIAAGFVGSLLIWMWKTGGTIKERMETRVSSFTSIGSGLGLFIFTFLMVLREGVETVLFLFALSASIGENSMYNVMGGGLGLLLAVLFGLFLIKGSLRINLKGFFAATSIVLGILVLELFANGLHKFFELGLLPSTETLQTVVGFLTKQSTSVFFLIALIAVPAMAMLRESW